MKITEFFKRLPPKKCKTCGRTMKEQHDCYINQCHDCFKLY